MTKGTIYIDRHGKMDAERLMTILVDNGYTVRVKLEENSIDCFNLSYRIDYKRKDEFDEE